MVTEQHTAKLLVVTKESREEIRKFVESNENENTTYQYLWDTSKAVLRRKFIAISAYIKKTQRLLK
jgi:hypothetical protein